MTRRIVILGGSYAGLRVARDLGRARRRGTLGREWEIVLINQSAWHEDPTVNYEVATAYLAHESAQSSEQISAGMRVSLSQLLASWPVTIQVGRVADIHPAERLLDLADGTTLSYDILVLAIGTQVATYGIPGVAEHAFSIKTLADALRLRHHIVRQFHQQDARTGQRPAALTFTVVGGGSSGVEMAAELAGHIRQECRKHAIDPMQVRILLLEAGRRLLATAPPHISELVHQRLERLNVRVLVHSRIRRVTATSVELATGQHVPTHTVVWTAGLAPQPLLAASGLPIHRWGVPVEPTLHVVGWPTIYAAGDVAVLAAGKGLPATVPVAYTQGKCVAANIIRTAKGQESVSYQFSSLGALTAVGGQFAILELVRGGYLVGWFAWVLKQAVAWRYWNWYLSVAATSRLSLARWRIMAKNDG